MTEVSSTSTIVLRKRKERPRDSLVLHLSSSPSPSYDPFSESEYEPDSTSDIPNAPPHAGSPKNAVDVDNRKRYSCDYDGCTKAYTKPSRLEEHQRSHTGDRPYVCSKCSKSYLRETHLHAHARSHLPSSSRPFTCEEADCNKRFWTAQHLRVHSELHRGEKPFKCNEGSCDASFMKHHQLREHICSTHAPPGTKPYRCEHSGCTKSFATNQKLRNHLKTHDSKRYTCAHLGCLASQGSSPVYYPTWTSLQHHMRTAHPPTCPHPSCNGKTFTAQKNLRAHLKIHDEREIEAGLQPANSADEDDPGEPPRKKRRGGEVGRDWVCEVPECGKDFKSKKALTTHNNVNHLGRRDFVCPHEDCKRAFGYKHLLQRHLAKLHAVQSEPKSASDPGSGSESSADESDSEPPTRDKNLSMRFDIEEITGHAYNVRSKERLAGANTLRCPHPDLRTLLPEAESLASGAGGSGGCAYVFSRAYDLRRHLSAQHRVEVERERVDEWVKREKKAKALTA